MSRTACVIGAGFGGVAAACFLARDGYEVILLEKNDSIGGRARAFRHAGFTFDMGPSWYLMPEVFERFFAAFSRRRSDYYSLFRLDPYYRVFFSSGEHVDIDGNLDRTVALFEKFEPGGGERLRDYLDEAEYKYKTAMSDFLYRDYPTILSFLNRKLLIEGLRLQVFSRLDRYVQNYFNSTRARQILEYAMVFLGSSPKRAPALYSIMSHVDLKLGVHFPSGGMTSIVQGLERLASELGVRIRTNAEVSAIVTKGRDVVAVRTADETYSCDVVVANADYAHVETELLDSGVRSYGPRYWRRRVIAPSMFILYLGLDKKLPTVVHHNLFFSDPWESHFDAVFEKPGWPQAPCYYLSCASYDDPTVAPPGKENVFILVPVAAGLSDDDDTRERYATQLLDHVERTSGVSLRGSIEFQRIYSQRDFARDYHAYRGTALGLAHTLFQTAVFRPPFKSRRLKNLYYTGQYTHPGVGVPMTLIAAEVCRDVIARDARAR